MEKTVLVRHLASVFPKIISVRDEASLSEVREHVRETGTAGGFTKELVERMVLVASELATNQLLHAKLGIFGARLIAREGVRGLEVFASDRGAGIADPGAALKGLKESKSGSLGQGLALVYQTADEVDIDVRAGEGSCILARKFEAPLKTMRIEIASFGRPIEGESMSGDDSLFLRNDGDIFAAVADGLGHGILARDASRLAMDTALKWSLKRNTSLLSCFQELHAELKGSRGAVAGLVRIEPQNRRLIYAGVGDITASLSDFRESKKFLGKPMVLGSGIQQLNRLVIEEMEVPAGAVFALYTDGLKGEAVIDRNPAVLRQPAIETAKRLVETFGRDNDDATVLVLRFGDKA